MKRTLSGSVDSKQKVLTFGPTGQLGVSHASYRSPDGPLADRMRPRTFEEFIGQDHIFFAGSPMAAIREGRHISSVILWGPPGTGKTTIARLVASRSNLPFYSFSAVFSGIREVKDTLERASQERKRSNKSTVIFIDEIHRFNKAQQDAFLPFVENGDIILIGATTENPSFEVNSALLSRARIVVLKEITPDNIRKILDRALAEQGPNARGVRSSVPVTADEAALELIANSSDGDARRALTALELAAVSASDGHITLEVAKRALAQPYLRYDKNGEEHFNLISALHKSLRDSDPQAALYWMCRMLAAGDDPLYVARRLIRFASEDVGLADPHALSLAVAAFQAYHQLGSPEGELSLANCCVYLATAPKSNSVYTAYQKVMEEIQKSGSLPPPLVIRNAPTRLMKDLGYGKDYQYAHDDPAGIADQQHFPDQLIGRVFYEPTDRGYEREIKSRMAYWEEELQRKRQKT